MEWLSRRRLGHWGFSFEFALKKKKKKQLEIHKKKKKKKPPKNGVCWEQTPGWE